MKASDYRGTNKFDFKDLPDWLNQFLIVGLYLVLMYSFVFHDHNSKHLKIESSDNLAVKSATYFYHYTLCVPAHYYFKSTSWLNSRHYTNYDNLNTVIGGILVIALFSIIVFVLRLVILKVYLIALFWSGILYIVFEIFLWIFK